MVDDGRVLGQNSNAALAFQLVGVHHAFGMSLVGAPGAALVEHGVHQRGLTVIDVRDDGDVADTRTQNSGPFS